MRTLSSLTTGSWVAAPSGLPHLELSTTLDSDGLVSHNDPVQQRIGEMLEKQRRKDAMRRQEIHRLRAQLRRANELAEAAKGANGGGGGGNGAGGGAVGNPLAAGPSSAYLADSEDSSVAYGGAESTASESSSWDGLEEDPSIRWVPDHATPTCMR